MAAQMENIIKAYKTLAAIPVLVSGKLNTACNRVTASWSTRNLDKGKRTKGLYKYYLDDKLNVIAQNDFATDISNVMLSSISPKETFRAVITEEKDKKDVKKQYLDIWKANLLAHSIDLNALEIHGDVYADGEFGSLSWSPDEKYIIYIAEKKLPKSEPYIKRKSAKDEAKTDGSGEAPSKKGEEHIYKQEWGEQLSGKHLSVIVLFDLSTETFTIMQGLPETWCPGQVSFSKDGKSVIGVGWETYPSRLGLIFCTNRLSWVFRLSLDGKMEKLSPDGMAVRSPRITPTGDLVWLQRTAGGPHHAAHKMIHYTNGKAVTLIDIIQKEVQICNGKFYGIYSHDLPENSFVTDKKLVFSTPQKTTVKSYLVDFTTTDVQITELNTPIKEKEGSLTVLDVKNDVVLASWTNMSTPSELYIGRVSKNSNTITWSRVSDVIQVPESVTSCTVKHMQIEHADCSDDVRSFTAIYTAPKVEEGKKIPLIVFPHGGPHSSFVDAFSLGTAFFTMLGYATIEINYRGSVGDGQASVDYLCSRIGDADVKDCVLATSEAVKLYQIDGKKLFLFGGSHGGFLVGHLSGQYPEMFKAVVSRNPVTDVATMANATDIADWCFIEAGFPYSEAGALSEDQLLQMRRQSPLAHVHKVKAPTCLMLGSADKRVPHYQGLEYYRRLKANGVVTRVYMYEDNHSLSSVPVEMDNMINSVLWFFEHLE